MQKFKLAGLAIVAALGLAAVPASAVTPIQNYAQFNQASNKKEFSRPTRLGGTGSPSNRQVSPAPSASPRAASMCSR